MGASKSELWDQLSKAIHIVEHTYLYGAAASPDLVELIDTLQQAYEGNHIGQTQAAMTSLRALYSSMVANYSSNLQALIVELARNGYNSVNTGVTACLDDIYDGMVGATETIKERGMTFSAITVGGSNVGTGTVYRVTQDKSGYNLENAGAVVGNVKVRITADRSSGKTLGNEEGSLYGNGTTKVDEIEIGSAPAGLTILTAKRAQDGLLTNASFSTYSGSGASMAFTGWTLSTATNFSNEATEIYRKDPGATTGVSIEYADNGYIQQNLGSTSLDITKPVVLIVRYKALSSCDGTLTAYLGTQSESVAVSGSTWKELTVGVGASKKGWYDVFKEDNSGLGFKVKIDLASRTTGTLVVDDIILAQPTFYNGAYYLLTAGATDYIKEDYFTFADTCTETGRNQYWLARLFGKHLPHTSGSPTYADAT